MKIDKTIKLDSMDIGFLIIIAISGLMLIRMG